MLPNGYVFRLQCADVCACVCMCVPYTLLPHQTITLNYGILNVHVPPTVFKLMYKPFVCVCVSRLGTAILLNCECAWNGTTNSSTYIHPITGAASVVYYGPETRFHRNSWHNCIRSPHYLATGIKCGMFSLHNCFDYTVFYATLFRDF